MPYEVKMPIKVFDWSKLEPKCICIKLGNLILQDINPQTQFCFFNAYPKISQCNYSSMLIVGGYLDNSFRIFNDNGLVQIIQFHKKLVTTVAYFTEKSNYDEINPQSLLIIGSKDCRISIWEFESIIGHKQPIIPKEKSVLYGHYNEIITLQVQQALRLIISADKDGVILIHSVYTEKLIRSYYPEMDVGEKIRTVQMDDQGLLSVLTTRSRIIVYTINGDLIKQFSQSNLMINHIWYITNIKPYLLACTSKQELLLINPLKIEKEIVDLMKNIRYQNKIANKNDYDEKFHKILLKTNITCLAIDETNLHVYCGFENGYVGIIAKPMKVDFVLTLG